jgi:hypothetical protein
MVILDTILAVLVILAICGNLAAGQALLYIVGLAMILGFLWVCRCGIANIPKLGIGLGQYIKSCQSSR